MNAPPLRVPYLTPASIERAAGGLLAAYEVAIGRLVEPPVPIDLIIEQHLKLDLAVVDLSEKLGRDDVLGATWFDKGMIRVDRRLEGHEGRISFTMAHEVGHWVLHRMHYEAEKLYVPLFPNDPVAADLVCRSSEATVPAERQANLFAAFLLMPTALVRAGHAAALVASPQLHRERLAGAVIAAGRFTNVSEQAMRIRLSDLGLGLPDLAQRGLFKT